MQATEANVESALAEFLTLYAQSPGPLLPILHALQERFGYIPATTIEPLATALRRTRADIHGVITFYTDFSTEAKGRRMQVCVAESCQARGSSEVAKTLEQTLGLSTGETDTQRGITLEPVYCLGHCACGPTVMIDQQLFVRVDEAVIRNRILPALTAEISA